MNDLLKNIIKQFMPFAQKQIGFKDPPRLFLRNDSENVKNPLGKTAFYDPAAKSVTLYVTGRHPKDILRSLGHELVHHKQNCEGHFDDCDDMGAGYAQKDPHLRQMEMDANRDGSMCLRDFEDMLKKQNTIYYEHLQRGENKMSTKDWKNKEVTQLLAEAWGFKFNSLQEFDEFNGTGEVQEEAAEDIEEVAGVSPAAKERRTRHKRTPVPEPEDDTGGEDSEESLEEGEEDLEEQSRTDRPDRARPEGGRRLDEEDDEVVEEAGGKAAKFAKGARAVSGIAGGAADLADLASDDKEAVEESEEVNEDEEVVEESEEETLQEAITKILRKHLKG